MNPSVLAVTLFAVLGLAACEKATVVAVPAAPVAVAGPAGPPGATGSQGETGKTGDATTIVVMPPAASAPSN